MIDDKRLKEAVDEINRRMWKEVADFYPEIKTGDLNPMQFAELYQEMQKAIREWIETNQPPCEHPSSYLEPEGLADVCQGEYAIVAFNEYCENCNQFLGRTENVFRLYHALAKEAPKGTQDYDVRFLNTREREDDL